MAKTKTTAASWKKWLLIAAGGGGLLLAGLLAALKIMFPPEKIQSLALEKLRTALGREVRIIDAAIGLGGIRLEGLEVSEQPDFAAGTFLKAQRLDVRIRLRPLILRKDIQIVRLSFEDWTVRVTAADAKADEKTPKKEEGKKDGAAAGTELHIAQLSLKKGAIEYRDEKAGTVVRLTEIEGKADDVRLDRAFDAALSFAYAVGEGKSVARGEVDFIGKIAPARGELGKIELEASPLKLVYDGLPMQLNGKLSDVENPDLDLKLSLPALAAAQLKRFADVPDGFHLPAMKGTLKARYTKGLLDLEKLELSGGGTSLSLSARQTAKGWEIMPSQVRWEGIEVRLSGTALSPTKKDILLDMKLDSNRVSLSKLAETVPKAVPEGLTGNAELHLRVTGAAASPELSGGAKFDAVGLAVAGQTLHGLEGEIAFSPKTVKGEVKGKMNKGDLELRVDAQDYRGDRPAYRLDGKLSELDLGTLPSSSGAGSGAAQSGAQTPAKNGAAAAIKTSGGIEIGMILHPNFQAGKSVVRWDLKDLTPDLARLGGSLKYDVGAGRFQDLALLSDKPLVKIVLMPIITLQKVAHLVKVPLFPKFDKVNFKEITGDYAFTNGVMQVKESHLDSSAAYAQMTGSADLGKDRLDLHVSTRLGVKQIAGPIGFKVSGSLSDPQVKLDTSSILKQPAVEKIIKSPEVEKVLDQGRQLLQGIFKR